MDPFAKLPAELQLKILQSFSDIKEALRGSFASPSLFRQRRASVTQFVSGYTTIETDVRLVQDALAIIHFPKRTKGSRSKHITKVSSHLRAWGKGELPNPMLVKHLRLEAVRELDGLFSVIRLYVEDYLGKAASAYMPRAYRQLPVWSHKSHFIRKSQHFLQAENDKHFRIASLSLNQRRTIFRAFLHYELLCKIYGPVSKAFNEAHNIVSGQNRQFTDWDWNILENFQAQENSERENRDLIRAVREYVLTLHGALLADQVYARLPEVGEQYVLREVSHETVNMTVFMRTTYWNSMKTFWHSLQYFAGTTGEQHAPPGLADEALSLMASCGFDLLTSIFNSKDADYRYFLDRLRALVQVTEPSTTTIGHEVPAFTDGGTAHKFGSSNGSAGLVHVYRQRACLLLGNDYVKRTSIQDDKPALVHGLCTREEVHLNMDVICHGQGYEPYEALAKFMVPFWKNVPKAT